MTSDLILTYDDALAAIDAGIWDWDELTRNLPRNSLPAVLAELTASSLLLHEPRQLARALTDAWVMCEFPEQAVSRTQWLEWFRQVGTQVTLYRGGTGADRMAWTSSRFVAEWFRDRWSSGRLWTATVDARHLLLHANNVRLDESGRSEDEYVIDPAGLRPEEIR